MTKTKAASSKKLSPIQMWVKAAKSEGFMVAGQHKKLPLKGTASYKRIRATYDKMKKKSASQ